ncbi:hypothetical protein IQ279_14240 [Streptomyces verrucosisporus]|nr:hypothetical protein [Streptomyces verrucosisporus]
MSCRRPLRTPDGPVTGLSHGFDTAGNDEPGRTTTWTYDEAGNVTSHESARPRNKLRTGCTSGHPQGCRQAEPEDVRTVLPRSTAP